MKTRITLIMAMLVSVSVSVNAQPGTVDPEFGGNSGTQYLNFLSNDEEWMTHMVVDQDDRIWVAGQTFIDNDGKLLLARLTADGNYDESFAGTGHAVVNVGGSNIEFIGGLALQNNDLIIAGYQVSANETSQFVIRYTEEGFLDQDFGEFGILSIPVEAPVNNVTIDATGNIYLACTGDDNVIVIKVLPDGTLDASFAFFGATMADFPTDDVAKSIAVNSEGRIFVFGTAFLNNQMRGTVTAFFPSGAVDTNFGNNGRGITQAPDNHFHLKDGILSEDDDIFYLAGQLEHVVTGAKDAVITSMLTDSSPNENFANGNGWLVMDLSIGGEEVVNRILKSEDGLYLACNVEEVPAGINSVVVKTTLIGSYDESFAAGGVGTYNIIQNGDDQALDLGLQSDGKLILSGIALNPEIGVFGYVTRIETDLTIGIENEIASPQLLVYPNPASEYLNVLLTNPQAGGHAYRIHNANGQLIRQGVIQTTEERLDISSLSPGYYMILLNDGGHSYFIKTR